MAQYRQKTFLTIKIFLLSLLVLFASLLTGCGGGSGGGGAAPVIAVTVTPNSVQVAPAQQATFSASVSGTNNQEVIWSVLEGLAGGAISEAGVYTAPGLAGTYHVVATSRANLTKNAVVPVNVHITLTVNPTAATLTLRESRQLTATIAGSQNQTVSWSIQEGVSGGSISTTGLYTAPVIPGIYHVIVTSQADPQQSAGITLTIVSGSASGTIE